MIANLPEQGSPITKKVTKPREMLPTKSISPLRNYFMWFPNLQRYLRRNINPSNNGVSQMFTNSLREKIAQLLKEAEEGSKCPSCGKEMQNGKCKNPSCDMYEKEEKEEKREEEEEEKEKEAAAFLSRLYQGAAALDYLSKVAEIENDPSGFSDYLAWETYLNKIAEDMGSGLPANNAIPNPIQQGAGELETNYAGGAEGMGAGELDTNEEEIARLQSQTQPTPFRGRAISAEESKMVIPKKANFVAREIIKRRIVEKLAQVPPPPPGQGAPAAPPPPPPPQGAPPPPQGGTPAGPPPQGGAPAAPDPVQIALQLQAQGRLTPETLAQEAAIPIEAATAVIAALTGTTAPPPNPPAGAGVATQPPPPPEEAPPPPPPQGGAPAPPPQGAPPPKQASADPSLLFQEALRKYANLSTFLGSNESAINFGGDDARSYNLKGIEKLFNKIPATQTQKAGKGEKPGADELLTSSKAAAAMWEFIE